MSLKRLIRRSRFALNVLRGKDVFLHLDITLSGEKFGTEYGGYTIIPNLSEKSIVYSVGIGEDISFDLALIKKFHCNIYAFDPTPKSAQWIKEQNLPVEFHFYPVSYTHLTLPT